jgi:hypothetical protein
MQVLGKQLPLIANSYTKNKDSLHTLEIEEAYK